MHNAADQEAALRITARYERNACTPKMAVEIMRRNMEIDVRPLLPAISTPMLVMNTKGDPIVNVDAARDLAARIPGAEFVELPGAFHGSWQPADVATWTEPILQFLDAGDLPARAVNRVLATVLFTDIVLSTELATRTGDETWHALLDQHDQRSSAAVDRYGGRLIKTTGDGVLATFDGPGRAIQCAHTIAGSLRPLGVNVRAGVHTGEVELRGTDIAGIAVVIASRVADLAGAGEVLVSQTVKDLVTGSGIQLRDRGMHTLKGVPDEWRLFAAPVSA